MESNREPGWIAAFLWQGVATAAYVGTHLVVGGWIERIDEGGRAFIDGKEPIILAPNHLGIGDGGIPPGDDERALDWGPLEQGDFRGCAAWRCGRVQARRRG